MFSNLKPIPVNAIQKAQNAFINNSRPINDPDVTKNKYALTQGHIYADQDYSEKDRYGNIINSTGNIFRMPAILEAQWRFAERKLADPKSFGYGNLNDEITKIITEFIAENIFTKQNNVIQEKRLAITPLSGVLNSLEIVISLIKKLNPEIDSIIIGSNNYVGYTGKLNKLFKKIIKYRRSLPNYEFDFESFENAIQQADPKKTLFLEQTDFYNYTGVNPSLEQKIKIVEKIYQKGIFTLLDSAYPGLNEDYFSDQKLAQLFGESKAPFAIMKSDSKDKGVYGERSNFLLIAGENQTQANLILQNLHAIIRSEHIAIAPNYKFNYELAIDPVLFEKWLKEDLPMARAIIRNSKIGLAEKMGDGFEYLHPEKTQGMFNGVAISANGQEWLMRRGIFTVGVWDEDNNLPIQRINNGGIPLRAQEWIAKNLRKAVFM
jgi:aspartate/tyrosine/aromatic aminotransferase